MSPTGTTPNQLGEPFAEVIKRLYLLFYLFGDCTLQFSTFKSAPFEGWVRMEASTNDPGTVTVTFRPMHENVTAAALPGITQLLRTEFGPDVQELGIDEGQSAGAARYRIKKSALA